MGKKKARKKTAKKKAAAEEPKTVLRIILPDGRCLDDLSPEQQAREFVNLMFGDAPRRDENGDLCVRWKSACKTDPLGRGIGTRPGVCCWSVVA